MASTRGGRVIIRNSLGTEGHKLMVILIDMMQRFTTQEKMDEIQKCFYQLMSKIGLLLKSGIIPAEIMNEMQGKNRFVADRIMKLLAIPPAARDVEMCISMLKEVNGMIGELQNTPIGDEKDVVRAQKIVEFFTTEGFLNFVLKDPSNAKPCETIVGIVHIMLNPPLEQSYALRMKINVAEKMSATRGGRATIRSLIGNEGHQLMMISVDMMNRFTTQEKVDEIQKAFYKLVSKVGLLIKEGIVSEESLDAMRRPNRIFADAIMKQLVLASIARDVEMCIRLFKDVLDTMILEMYSKKTIIDNKDVVRAQKIVEFFTTEGFLNFVLKDPSNAKPCETIVGIVNTMMNPPQEQVVSGSSQLPTYGEALHRI
jgi:hypothetical protein